MNRPTIGADPEFFLYQYERPEDVEPEFDDYGDEIYTDPYIPAVGIVPGTKEEPHDLGDGFFCHEDNVALELGIPPTGNAKEFGTFIQEAKNRVTSKFLDKHNMELMVGGMREFAPHQLESKQAKEFGCEPDYDAYTNGAVRKIPDLKFFGRKRYAGGHVHIGGSFNCPPFIAALFGDLFLSLPMYTLGGDPRSNGITPWDGTDRIKWYGQPGIFREKPYGIEYRTPSNWWCTNGKSATLMGHAAVRLGAFLQNTSATNLRSIVRKVPWLDVKEFLTNPPNEPEDRRNSASSLCADIGSATGIEI